jgi:hypothetical protein
MSRPRGGYIGHNAAPAASAINSAASGVWTLREAEALKRAGTWPVSPVIATSLLLHCDGSNGSATFLDSSPNPKSVTASGNAQVSTVQSQFGGASALFDGNGDFLTITDSQNDFAFGTGDFTLEWWFRSSATNAFCSMMTRLYSGPGGFLFSLNGGSGNGRPEIYWREFGNALFIQSSAGGFNDGQWHHCAFVRQDTTCYMYVDGISRGSRADISTSVPSSTIYIGSDRQFGGRDFSGHIDEIRITKGVCWYPGGQTFTPSSQAFS